MDYLDRKKTSRHHVILFTGYILIAVAITISTLILLYSAYGFGVTRSGDVIQNGLSYFSSQPSGANIYVNGKLKSDKTNTRLVLPENVYSIKLARDGYRDWQRTIELRGGSVEHFDYPFLFPRTLASKKADSFKALPSLMTQSPDRRWVLSQQPDSFTTFTQYDIKNPDNIVTGRISLPDSVLSKANTAERWQVTEWSADNVHVVLRHIYDDSSEYILLDRDNPEQSLNLSKSLGITASTTVTLNDRKYNRYYRYDTAALALQTAELENKVTTAPLQRILAYKTYGDDTVLYVTDSNAPKGTVLVKLKTGDKTIQIRSLPAGSNYLVDLTKYSGTMYVAAGAGTDNRVYIYKDPNDQLRRDPKHVAVPTQVLHVENANYLSFSSSAQYIVAQNGGRFGVYDIENETGYNYTSAYPVDAPQEHATWMDGNRLMYTSGGKLVIFDYDNLNPQTLVASQPAYNAVFSPNYRYLYTVAPADAAGVVQLNQTPLLTPADL